MTFTRKERVSGQWCYLIVESIEPPRLVFYYQIPKKIVSKAVDRNLIKRRLRAIITPYRHHLPLKAFTIGIKVNPMVISFNELKLDLNKLLNKYAA